jgi:hypothetical protein
MKIDESKIKKYNEVRAEFNLIRLENAKELYEMLYVLDLVFTKFDIEYSLAFGSILGAIRNKGLIPWDDDIDVMTFEQPGNGDIIYREEVLREFNKYGMNVLFQYAVRTWERRFKPPYLLNGIYKESNQNFLVPKPIKIKRCSMWGSKQKSLCGGGYLANGRTFRGGGVFILDIFPMKNYEKTRWRSAVSAYKQAKTDILTTDEIFPLKKNNFGNTEVSTINENEKFCKRVYGENCFTDAKYKRSHTCGKTHPSRVNKINSEANRDLLINLEVPSLFDPHGFKTI